MRTLDIIMTHYNEPWEIGEPYFQILDLQVGVDFSKIRVILVHDGSDPFPEELFVNRPYEVKQISIEHGGVSAARNAGIDAADAEWISFSDFDDMYLSAISLKAVLDTLLSEASADFDMLGASFVGEDLCADGSYEYRPVSNEDMAFIHAKYYRLDFLQLHNIKFNTSFIINEDGLFNAMVHSWMGNGRHGGINSNQPVYLWRYRGSSITATPGMRWQASLCLFRRNVLITRAYESRMPHKEFAEIAARTLIDAYYLLHHESAEQEPEYDDVCHEIKDFYHKYRHLLDEISSESLRMIRNAARSEYEDIHPESDRILKLIHNQVKLKPERPHFWKWVDMMDSEVSS